MFHVIAHINIAFLFMAKSYPIKWIYYILFIHLSVDICLTCFYILAIMIGAAVNICLQVFGGCMFSFLVGIFLGVELLGHIGPRASFLRYCQTVFHFAFPSAMFCSLFTDPRGTRGCFWPGRGSWGPQPHQPSDRRKNRPGMSPLCGEMCVLYPFPVNPGSLSQLGLLDLEMLLQSQGEEPLHAGEAARGNDFLPLESTQGGCVWSGSESPHNTFDLYSSHGNIKVRCVHVCL